MERYGIVSSELSDIFAGYKAYFFSTDSEREYVAFYRNKEDAEEAVTDWEELGRLPEQAEAQEA